MEDAVRLLRSRAARLWRRVFLVVIAVNITANLVAIAIIRSRGGHTLDWVASDFGIRLYAFAIVVPVILHSFLFGAGFVIAMAITNRRRATGLRSGT